MNTPDSIIGFDIFEKLEDPRQQVKVLYPLREVLLVVLCAIICGADSYVEIEEFGKAKIDFLKRFFPFESGIPSHDTFGIIFSKIDSKKFNEVFIEWVLKIQNVISGVISIDGKTCRRSMDNKKKPIHVVSAWAAEQRLVIGQTQVPEKTNEITAIPELLSKLVLKGAIVTIDAMGCQKAIVKNIIEKEADYVIAVKQNQKTLFSEISTVFEAALSQTADIEVSTYQTVDKGHGRIETRIYGICDKVDILQTKDHWEGIQSIGYVTSVREENEKTSTETRYFISSLPADVHMFAKAVRSHWGIENQLHWVLDIVFRDDECRIRKQHGPANFVIMKHIASNMLRSIPGKQSMRVRRKKAGWDNEFLARAIMGKIS